MEKKVYCGYFVLSVSRGDGDSGKGGDRARGGRIYIVNVFSKCLVFCFASDGGGGRGGGGVGQVLAGSRHWVFCLVWY